MGLLAPLYALAALAVAAPVLFHLIRRQPRGQFEFSSLMFLQASPPRLTRRSRLDNILLLLLRALVLCLLAIAFARPFWRSVEVATADAAGREILLMVDTSGSMQRTNVWERAVAEAKKYCDGLGKSDRIGLATFDSHLKILVPLPDKDQLDQTTPTDSHSAVRAELAKIKPSFRKTDLADQLMEAAELMQARSTAQDSNNDGELEIVLISDLHEGSGIEALQGFSWPENVRVDVRRIAADRPGNARATLMQPTPGESSPERSSSVSGSKSPDDSPADAGNAVMRVRIENNENSATEALSLRWLQPGDDPGSMAPDGSLINVQVPAGQARVIPIARPVVGQADRLLLTGDAATHDNVVFVPETAPRQERLGFIGQTRSKSEDDLFFFLHNIPLSTPVRTVTIERIPSDQAMQSMADESLAGLVVEWPFAETLIPSLEEFARSGRPVVVVLSRPGKAESAVPDSPSEPNSLEQARVMGRLLDIQSEIEISEAPDRNFALLTDIEFRHPLFLPLSDAKYNDFAKIRFWAHRILKLPESHLSEGKLRVLARFDDHSPALIQRTLGRGDLWILTAGWQATASQLALSTKFVPLMFGMLDPQGRSMDLNAVYEVEETIPVLAGVTASITDLKGKTIATLQRNGGLAIDEPGCYWLTEDGKSRQIAVALPMSESQLVPLDLDRLTQFGVLIGKSNTARERQASARLSQVTELESRQKLWRWILVGALGVLILETILASNQSKAS